MGLVQEGTLHHGASEHMVHTSYGSSTLTELDSLRIIVLDGRTLMKPTLVSGKLEEEDAGHRP